MAEQKRATPAMKAELAEHALPIAKWIDDHPTTARDKGAVGALAFLWGLAVAMQHPEWAQAKLALMPEWSAHMPPVVDRIVRDLPIQIIGGHDGR